MVAEGCDIVVEVARSPSSTPAVDDHAMRTTVLAAQRTRLPPRTETTMETGSLDPERWVAALAARLDVPAPSAAEVEDLLALAGSAAHAAERWVAPVSTWLVARAGLTPAAARAVVDALAAELGAGPTDA